MASFNKEILLDTISRTVVKFTHNGVGAIASGALTGGIFAPELSGYGGGRANDPVQMNISKIFYSIPMATSTPHSVAIAWNKIGSLTGQDAMYVHGTEYVDFSAFGTTLKNTVTGGDSTSGIIIRNITAMTTGDAVSVIVELDKVTGFGYTG